MHEIMTCYFSLDYWLAKGYTKSKLAKSLEEDIEEDPKEDLKEDLTSKKNSRRLRIKFLSGRKMKNSRNFP